MAAADETGHVEGVVACQTRHAETGGYVLAGIRTVVVSAAGERRPRAGNIDHLALGKCVVEILSEPYGPMVTESLLCSSLSILFHYEYLLKNASVSIVGKSTGFEADFTSRYRENRSGVA
jgi:hypothetical protein